LPSTGLVIPDEKKPYHFFPDTAALIAIAILEKRNDDVLHWYKQRNKGGRLGWGTDYQGDTVAAAVQETHPDEALGIWKRSVTDQVAMTKPAAYESAGAYLKKMRVVYKKTGRLADWKRFIAELCAEHSRKPRFIEVLDGLEGKQSRILKA
jgi:uncharacterized Zn finger protein